MSRNRFTCAACGGEFVSSGNRTEEDRLAEMRQAFGNVPTEQRARVCHDCWLEVMKRYKTTGLA